MMNRFSRQCKEILGNGSSEKILVALKDALENSATQSELEDYLERKIGGASAKASRKTDVFGGNLQNLINFVEFLGGDTRDRLKKFIVKFIMVCRERFNRDVLSIVDEGYKKALTLSDELLDEDRKIREQKESGEILGLLREIRAGKIKISKGNRLFLMNQVKLFRNQAKINKKLAKFGNMGMQDVLLENLKSSKTKFSEFEFGFAHLRNGWNRMFIWFSRNRLDYLKKQA